MVDYTRSTGSSGVMMIRDTGTTVEFWLNAGNSTTWSDHIPWGYTVNGASGNTTVSYPAGSGWKRVGYWAVSTGQTVQFRLGNTGTSGFGGPTTFNQEISRGTVPPAPNPVVLSAITATSMHANFSGNGDGGSSITAWQIGYGTDPTTPFASVDFFDYDFTGLDPGMTYYFWARGVNAIGYGPWSVRSSATTLRVPDPPSAPALSDIRQTSLVATFVPNGDGGSPIVSYQIGYGTSPGGPTTAVSAVSPKTMTGLTPGTTYYFWVRATNGVGTSPWSAPTSAKMIAGARVKVGTTWYDAVPYVRSGGVWKIARPWVRVAGEWKQTS